MDNEKEFESVNNDENKSNNKKALIIKIVIVAVAAAIVIGGVFFACSRSGKEPEGLEAYDDEYGFEYETVTDENGEPVTDENGDTVTTEVEVKYEKDKKGNKVAYKVDENGNYVTDKNGNKVTVPTNKSGKGETADNGGTTTTGKFTTATTEKPTGTTKKENSETKSGTTAFDGYETVPKTSTSGEPVNFSAEDLSTIKNMLEVPYLYLASYENTDGVPIGPATQTAIWMASRSTGDRSDATGPLTFSANEVVLNLFKYYGQTVVNFKSQCNNYATGANAAITYDRNNDTFTIAGYTSKVQTVTITSVEDVGDNNFYKVTADVSGCNKTKVVAIVQKNRLDPSLGFSIKALKWS